MPASSVGPIRRLWAKWRSLKLPWRRRWLAGMDLNGNTFWEFKDSFESNRFRRIAQAHDPRVPYADLKISPQWHQWLRHTRFEPPSMFEQQSDVQRQVELKQLARLADERWAAKPSLLDPPPDTSKYEPATTPRDRGGYVGKPEPEGMDGARSHVVDTSDLNPSQASELGQKKEKVNPWRVNRGSPGEEWQPQAWTPEGSGKQ